MRSRECSLFACAVLLAGVMTHAQSAASAPSQNQAPAASPQTQKLRGRDQVLRDIAKNNGDAVAQEVRDVMGAYEVDMYRLVLRVGKRYGMDTAYDIMSEGVTETRSRWADQAISGFKASGTEVEQGLAFYRQYLGAPDDEFKIMELTKDKVTFKRKDYVNAIYHASETLGLDPVTVNNKVYAPATTRMLARVNPGLKHSFLKYDGDGWYEEMITYTPAAQTSSNAGQTKTDAPASQSHQPVMMYRFYEGADGLSHVEKIAVDLSDHTGPDDVAKLMAVSGAAIHRTPPSAPGAFGAFHPAGRRQYVINLSGHEEIEFSGGEKITLNPGDIELAEDTAPSKGHRNLVVGPEDRVAIFIPLADQTSVRGPLSNGAVPNP